ncbi:MAG: LPS-assembly protein LptD [Spirochaetaceae bacterium]|nr:LPS-assembly protein LptD [Spirochaetaceae bacterium]
MPRNATSPRRETAFLAMLLSALFAAAGQEAATVGTGPPPADPAAGSPGSTIDGASAAGSPPDAASGGASPGAAQGGAAVDGVAAAEEGLLRKTLSLDISTASFHELAEWCRGLGLPATGSQAELRSRLYGHYGLSAPEGGGGGGRSVTIERAAEARYFELEEGSGELVRLSGGVVLTIRDEGKAELHRLEASEILYDRARNAVTATGRVNYRREGGGLVEEFFGETLSADLDDWSGVFLDGKLRRSGEGARKGERGLSFSADTMLRRSGDVIVLENGVVSSCDEEEPHYSIKSKKMWLLGENEWAVADAVVSVGKVPLIWLPFFYYPGDEIVFHPVFGYRSREGRLVQTTTYLIGQKPASKAASGFLRMSSQASSGPKELRGLFLHPEGKASSSSSSASGPSLKLLVDLYSGLGALVGLDGRIAPAGGLEKLEFSSAVGLSRSLFGVTGGYSPYVADGAWKSVWNRSNFAGSDLPFRYGFDLQAAFRAGSLSLSLAAPLYSDPSFEKDFRDRSEDMEWLKLSTATSTTSAVSSTAPGKRMSLLQRLDLSLGWKPEFLAPFVTQADITRLGVSLSWQAKQATKAASQPLSLFSVDPAREFFYPDLLRPFDGSLTLRGSLVPAQTSGAATAAKPAASGDASLRSPWNKAGEPERAPDDSARPDRSPGVEQDAAPAEGDSAFRLPPRLPDVARTASKRPFSLSADWSLSPSAFREDRFLSDAWLVPADIDFSNLYTLSSYRVGATLGAQARFYEDLATASLGLTFSAQDQSRTATSDPAYAARIAAYRLADAQFKQTRLSSSLKFGFRPFADSWLLGASTLSYGLDALLYELAFDKVSGPDYLYKEKTPAWSAEGVTNHQAALVLGFRTGAKTQSLGLSMSFPPTKEAYAASLGLEAGEGDLGLTFSLKGRMFRDGAGAAFSYDPLVGGFSAQSGSFFKLSDTLSYDLVNARPLSNAASVLFGPLSATVNSSRSKNYKPVSGSGWIPIGDEAFRATELVTALKADWKAPADAAVQQGLGLSASYTQNLLRFSESTISFGLSYSLKVSGLLELSISSLSQNAAAWRYWPTLFPAVREIGDPAAYAKNPFVDVWQSLSFWDSAARRQSLFKLKSLSFKAVHDLHDWDLTLEASAAPRLDTTVSPYVYVFDTKLSILLAWRDLPEIKANVKRETSGWSF